MERLYGRAVAELESALRATLFPALPAREGRPKMLAELIGTSPSEAMYLLDELYRALPVTGDVCEFGVAEGATSALLASELTGTVKNLWIYDSFAGLPAPTEKDVLLDDIFSLGAMARYEGTMCYDAAEARRRVAVARFPPERLHVVEGFIEPTSELPDRICFAYVDFDFYQPVTTALLLIDGRISAGGAVVVDDYGFFSAGAQSAVDEFLAARVGHYEVVRPLSFAGHFLILRRR